MLAALARIFVSAMVIATASSCAPPAPKQMHVPPANRAEATLEAGIVQQVNAFRRSIGVSTLTRHPDIDTLARQHSRDLLTHHADPAKRTIKLSHHGFDRRAFSIQIHLGMGLVGENIVATNERVTNMPAHLTQIWAHSPDHLENMEGSTWTHTGVGVACDATGMLVATQIFAAPVKITKAPKSHMDLLNQLRVH